ncbi:MAG: hypothetical protein JWN98_1335 [Abditibacteriota bacterium]|nr:hypothetical protein [Abditibacteriota bacterium]
MAGALTTKPTASAPNTPRGALPVCDVSGKSHQLPHKAARATVLLFSAVDCPISNSYAPEVNRLMAQFKAHKIAFFIVYPDGDTDKKKALRHSRDFGYTSPVLLDGQQTLARRFGASVTPQAVVLSPQSTVLYRGRIDDRYVTWGRKRTQPQRRELSDALQAIARGRKPAIAAAPAIGCFIPNVGSNH